MRGARKGICSPSTLSAAGRCLSMTTPHIDQAIAQLRIITWMVAATVLLTLAALFLAVDHFS